MKTIISFDVDSGSFAISVTGNADSRRTTDCALDAMEIGEELAGLYQVKLVMTIPARNRIRNL